MYPMIRKTLVVVILTLSSAVAVATPDADSWQEQTLLATTADEYLVLEKGGYTPGFPAEYVEVLRYVVYSAKTNEQVREMLISATRSRLDDDDGSSATTHRSELDKPLSELLAEFDGTIPRTSKNLAKRFVADASGVYVMDGEDKVLVFRGSELSKRKSGAGNAYQFEQPRVIDLKVGSGNFYLTMRSEQGNGRHEVVMAITR